MGIQDQKSLAKRVIEQLRPHGFNIILAGGAVRDWYREQEANDLDFFIAGEPRPDALNQILQVDITPLTDKTYAHSLFEGFQCVIEGQVCQFLFHQCEDPREHVRNRFPVACSEAWYDGERFWYSDKFLVAEKYNVLIFEESRINNWRYVDKLERRDLHKTVHFSLDEFLRNHFSRPRDALFV